MARPNQKRWRSAVVIISSLLSLALPDLRAQWTQTTSLPDGYADHSLAYWNGFLYQAGGSSSTGGLVDGTNVFYAHIQSGGTIGTWKSARPLPEAVLQHAGVVANGFLYVMGGIHYNDTIGDFYSAVVYYSKINTNGSLGDWHEANPLPHVASFPSAAVWNSTIYVIGGFDNQNLTNAVYSAKIQPDGSLSAWVAQTPVPVPNGSFGRGVYTQSSVANGFLYVLGGVINGGDTVSSNVYYSAIDGDGTLTSWNQTTPLPQPLDLFGAVSAGGRIFIMGGDTDAATLNKFYSTAVLGNGSLGAWLTGPGLPLPLAEQGVAADDSYIFLSGGMNSRIQPQSGVYSTPLPEPPAAPTLVSRSFTNGNFQLQLASATNTGFGLLASTNLTTWTNIGWGFTDTNGTLLLQDTNAASFPTRFYRAYWPLP